MKKKIAFCFLIKDKIYNNKFYNNYFNNIDKEKYEIIIHYKTKPDLSFFKHTYSFTDKIIETKWAKISLVNASLLLFDKACKLNCDYFLLMSGDMLPLINFNDLYNTIINYDSTLFSVCKNKKSSLVENNLKRIKLNFNIFLKQNMFFCLKKIDYEKINFSNYIPYYNNVIVPDEFFFINIFNYENKSYKSIDYIVCNTNIFKTQAIVFSNNNQINNICLSKYLFIRKIHNYKVIDYFSNFIFS